MTISQVDSRLDSAALLVEELIDKLQTGDTDVEAFIAAHPEQSSTLRRLLPALRVMADLSNSAEDGHPSFGSGGAALGELGDFRIVREVGRGGMGIVYEAEQISLGRPVALKVLPFAATMDPRQLQRFQNEARAAGQLHHTNIVPVYAVGRERGVHFYAMQYIEGQSLATAIESLKASMKASSADRQPLDKTKPYHGADAARSPAEPAPAPDTVPVAAASTLPPPRDRAYFRKVAELGIQAAEALDHAHQMGVIHRDVKPANLMLDATGRLWVTDFGLAQVQSDTRLTMTGDLIGTLRYMSPEQALAKRVVVDHRTDIYSLGATLYELLTMEPAYRGNDRQELMRQIAFEEPRPLRRVKKAIPAELETIVLKAMEKNPAERYATAHELAHDLRHFLEDKPIRARRPTLFQRARKWARRHQSVVRAIAAFFALAVIGLAIGIVVIGAAYRAEAVQRTEAENQRTEAENQRTKAVNQKLLAQQERDRARAAHYATSMHATYGAWHAGDINEARELLDTFIPRPGQLDLRGWEWHYLHALCQRECLTLSRPADESVGLPAVDSNEILYFYSTAWSPDGRRLATCSGPGHRGEGYSISGPNVVGIIEVWDAGTGRKIRGWTGHTQGRARCVAWSPNGKKLASASADGTIGVWNPDTGQRELSICVAAPGAGGDIHHREVHSVAWSPDGQRLASASRHGSLKIWDAVSGKELLALTGHRLDVFSAAWSPDCKKIGSFSFDGSVRIWDALTGRQLQFLDVRRMFRNGTGMVSWSPNGKLLAAVDWDTVRIWDVMTGQCVLTCCGHSEIVLSVAWSPEGMRLATSSWDRTARIWDVTTGKEILCLRGHTGSVTSVAWHPDGRRLATTSGDGTVKVWDALSDQESLALRPAWPVGKVAWSADGKQIWLSTALGEYVHNTSTGLEVAAFPVSPREWLSWSSERSDGKWLAYRLGGGPVRVCDLLTGRQVRPLAVHERSSTTGAWSPDGKRLALSDCQYGPGADPTDPKRISRTWEGVRIWDTTTWRELLTLTCKIPNGASPPQQVQWSPGGDRIAAMGSAMIWVFDASSGDVVFTSRRPDLQHFASSLAWHPDGKAIAVGEFGGAISVLDSITGRELTTFRGHTPQVTALAWTPDGKRLASGALGVQSEIKVWDAATWNLVLAWRRLPSGGVHSLVWSPDGKRLACAVGGQAKVWDAAPRSSAWGNMAPQNCLWATFLATCADLRWRDTVQALRLAQKAVRADPRKGEYWAALGKAQYRAGNWKDALASLTKSLQLHEGPYVYEWYFLAMTCWQLGQKEQARDWYHKAILWNDKNILPGEALPRFRKEAEEVLGIKPGMRAGAS